MALPVGGASGFGVLEFRSIRVLGKAKNQRLNFEKFLHCSITPLDSGAKGRVLNLPWGTGQNQIVTDKELFHGK
jgi:hypothetical protein